MRKINAILTAAILVLFLLHGIMGAFTLTGIAENAFKLAGYLCMALIGVHAVIGILLMRDTLRAGKASGARYTKENRLFWARRISGFALLVLMFFHIGSFGYVGENGFRLRNFDAFRLAAQLLLVAALAVHIISNVKPAMISFGIRLLKGRSADILFVLSVLLLFMAAAFVIYYLRWIRV